MISFFTLFIRFKLKFFLENINLINTPVESRNAWVSKLVFHSDSLKMINLFKDADTGKCFFLQFHGMVWKLEIIFLINRWWYWYWHPYVKYKEIIIIIFVQKTKLMRSVFTQNFKYNIYYTYIISILFTYSIGCRCIRTVQFLYLKCLTLFHLLKVHWLQETYIVFLKYNSTYCWTHL